MPRQPRVEGFAALGGQLIVRDRPRSVALERLDDVITVVVLNQVAGLTRLERESSIFDLRALGAAAAREPAHIAALEPGRSVDRDLLGHIGEVGATRELGLGFPCRALVQRFDLADVDLVLSTWHLLLADNGLQLVAQQALLELFTEIGLGQAVAIEKLLQRRGVCRRVERWHGGGRRRRGGRYRCRSGRRLAGGASLRRWGRIGRGLEVRDGLALLVVYLGGRNSHATPVGFLLQQSLVDQVVQDLIGQGSLLLIDIAGDVGASAELLGLGVERAYLRPDFIDELACRNAVRADLGDDLVGSDDIVVDDSAGKDGQHQAGQNTHGDEQYALLVLFALPPRLLASARRRGCRAHGGTFTFVCRSDTAWSRRCVTHAHPGCGEADQVSCAVGPVAGVSRTPSTLGKLATVSGLSVDGAGACPSVDGAGVAAASGVGVGTAASAPSAS